MSRRTSSTHESKFSLQSIVEARLEPLDAPPQRFDHDSYTPMQVAQVESVDLTLEPSGLLLPGSELPDQFRSLILTKSEPVDRTPERPAAGSARDVLVSQEHSSLSRASSVDPSLAKVAAAAADDLLLMEFFGAFTLDSDSVYGLAIAMPQIARSDPTRFYMGLALRSYLLLFLNILLQGSVLIYLAQAGKVYQVLGGQMHLCDFGAALANCPGGSGCVGPGGTKFTIHRIYSYTQWAMQRFIKQALVDTLPGKRLEIETNVDPGEYGIENSVCRLVASFLFTTSVITELFSCFEILGVLWWIPGDGEPWIVYPDKDTRQDPQVDEIKFQSLNLVKFKVTGMPKHWKFINFCVVLIPKFMMWLLILWEGQVYLMDTAGILDLLLGCLSLSFICSIDEMILSALASKAGRYIMTNLEQWENRRDSDANENGDRSWFAIMWFIFPRRLACVIGITAICILRYYSQHCRWDEQTGNYVSTDMAYPNSVSYNFMNFFITGISYESAPFWRMSTPT